MARIEDGKVVAVFWLDVVGRGRVLVLQNPENYQQSHPTLYLPALNDMTPPAVHRVLEYQNPATAPHER